MVKYFVFVFLFMVLVQSGRIWHTSQISLVKLYDLQKQHFNIINDYLDSEMKRLDDLEKSLASMYKWHQSVTNNFTYLHNHINGMQTINRIFQQIHEIEDLINNKNSMAALNYIGEDNDFSSDYMYRPTQALRRLQRFYDIPASEMAAGRYMDQIIGDEINACECYVIAKHFFEIDDMGGALNWGVQAREKWMNSSHPKCVDIKNLDYVIVVSSLYVGYDYRTLFDQKYSYSINTKKFTQYFSLVSAEMNLHEGHTLDIFDSYQSPEHNNAEAKFKILCRHGKSNRTLTKDLQCRYQTKNSSYRILMPFKEEDVDTHPNIKLYHDILYDGEIQSIKSLVTDKMRDGLVLYKHRIHELNEVRRSGQVSWIYNEEDKFKIIESIDARVLTITGLSLISAEAYQISNYGLGGHFVPHHDAYIKINANPVYGNRMITVLFYLSDVLNNGYTVFPLRDIVVPVKTGSAIVWNNLHSNNGQIYNESLHGSCSMLKGNKWIMTKWFHERGQFLSYDWKNNSKHIINDVI